MNSPSLPVPVYLCCNFSSQLDGVNTLYFLIKQVTLASIKKFHHWWSALLWQHVVSSKYFYISIADRSHVSCFLSLSEKNLHRLEIIHNFLIPSPTVPLFICLCKLRWWCKLRGHLRCKEIHRRNRQVSGICILSTYSEWLLQKEKWLAAAIREWENMLKILYIYIYIAHWIEKKQGISATNVIGISPMTENDGVTSTEP